MDIREVIKSKRLYFDGGAGTLLQSMGLESGEKPEYWNLKYPERIIEMHKRYLSAGANIITTNTFGANREKFDNFEEIISAGIECAKKAAENFENCFVAFDMGPTGKLLEPLGELKFEDAVSIFADNVKIAEKCGADLVIIETMNDAYETKAAVLAVKENSDLPVFVTNVFDETSKLMTGASPLAMSALLEGLGVDAVGMNCSLGPDKLMPTIDEYLKYSSLPLIVNPNAGLPSVENGKTVYNIDADEFSDLMRIIAQKGACILGGCCGTTPEYIKATIEKTKDIPYCYPTEKTHTVVSSYTHGVLIGEKPQLIGERINPTGKKKLKEALKNNDLNYILNEGVTQAETGVAILDVNVGLPEIDEVQMMKTAVSSLQAVTNVPLQIDTSDPKALETALRIYNGKALVNSVNGKEESMTAVFPLVKKYGGAVIALTLDEDGIPETAEKRVEIAKKIIARAKEYGIDKKDIIVDPLAMTISSDTTNALTTLKAISEIRKLGVYTSLGVSNISFGLPERQRINSAFFAIALENGLNLAIMNPFSVEMMNVYYAFCALKNLDANCTDYIEYATANGEQKTATVAKKEMDLHQSIVKGVAENAVKQAEKLLEDNKPLDIINSYIIPALNEIGNDFENKKAYLPQLLMSAEAASGAFEVIKSKMNLADIDDSRSVVIATVKGDIHDIGKNIVKVLLESYGFKVIDLGRDVPPETIVKCAVENNCKLVGLSALMSTTVTSMEETIKLLNETDKSIKTVVGGAVLTDEYAKMINADYYAEDAMATVRIAEEFYK